MEFQQSFDVRWADLDANRHLRNTAYSEYATHLRFTFLAQNGFDQARFQALQIGPVVFREETRFLKEVLASDRITVAMEVMEMTRHGKWHIRHPVHRSDGALAAVVDLEGAFFSLATRKLTQPPPELVDLLLQLQETA
jgi:acyl-CoA thioester hydrolase